MKLEYFKDIANKKINLKMVFEQIKKLMDN